MSYIEHGDRPEPLIAARQMGEFLVQLHRTPWEGLKLPSAEDRLKDICAIESPWTELLLRSLPDHHPEPVLLHGDLWPGNVIWQDGRIAAVIDWEDARLGDPWADLGAARLEILWMWGEEAMHAFTDAFRNLSPAPMNAWLVWDIAGAIRLVSVLQFFGLSTGEEARHRALADGFLRSAVVKLRAQAEQAQ